MRAAAHQSDVVAVVTQPDRPAGRGQRLTPTAVKTAARELGLPVFEPVALKPFAADLRAFAPDVLVVASYGRILPPAVLDVARTGIAFNVHPSLLPLYRGATPLQSAIRDGCEQTGVTIIAMDAGMDTGDILVQEPTAIGPRETYGELHDRLARYGGELLARAFELLAAGRLTRIPQRTLGVAADEIAATATRPLEKADLIVDWSWPARRIVDTVRALAPTPGARANLAGEPVKLLAARMATADEVRATVDGGIVERAGDGQGVVVLRLTPPNRRSLTGIDYLRTRAAV